MNRIIIGGAVILTAALAGAALSIRLKRREYTVVTGKIKKPFTAVHISDLHESRFGKDQDKLIRMVADEKPDVIFITGDMVDDNKHISRNGVMMHKNENAWRFFRRVSKIAPCYVTLGNHESYIPNTNQLCEEISETGVDLLHPTTGQGMTRDVCINGNRVLIVGANDPYFDRENSHRSTLSERFEEDTNRQMPVIVNWRAELRKKYANIGDEERLTLLLSHRPEEYELYRELGFDVAFSGHAHGGQWRLPPFINGIYAPHQGLFPKYAGGCYRFDGLTHIVSRGLSKKRMIRIFNRPEVCVVKFIP